MSRPALRQLSGTLPPLTTALLAISLIVSLLSGFGKNLQPLLPLLIASDPRLGLQEILQGQWWRLITPVFLHFGLLHIIFNMLWLWDLGGAIERYRGIRLFAALVLFSGISSNLAQYAWSGPAFGGMSGVVYALLAYVWVQGRFYPRGGIGLPRPVAIMMLVWYVLCWTGLIGPVANMGHSAGLLAGLLAGFVPPTGHRQKPA